MLTKVVWSVGRAKQTQIEKTTHRMVTIQKQGLKAHFIRLGQVRV